MSFFLKIKLKFVIFQNKLEKFLMKPKIYGLSHLKKRIFLSTYTKISKKVKMEVLASKVFFASPGQDLIAKKKTNLCRPNLLR